MEQTSSASVSYTRAGMAGVVTARVADQEATGMVERRKQKSMVSGNMREVETTLAQISRPRFCPN